MKELDEDACCGMCIFGNMKYDEDGDVWNYCEKHNKNTDTQYVCGDFEDIY